MTVVSPVRDIAQRVLDWPVLNFALTNWIPRRHLTLFMAWFSRIEHPWVSALTIRAWRFFADVDLSDARKEAFSSLRDCFVRELRDGARPVDARTDVLVSPCDAIVGAVGSVRDGMVLQAKGKPYTVAELLCDESLARYYEGGTYVTLRLTAGMYHRFHAPQECQVTKVSYVPGDVWNVNPPALQRVERLYCRNERAVLSCTLTDGKIMALVPVAAILVASLRLHCLDRTLHLRYQGPHTMACDQRYAKGEEMGWFEQGSTIIVFVPRGYALADGIVTGTPLRMGEALLQANA